MSDEFNKQTENEMVVQKMPRTLSEEKSLDRMRKQMGMLDDVEVKHVEESKSRLFNKEAPVGEAKSSLESEEEKTLRSKIRSRRTYFSENAMFIKPAFAEFAASFREEPAHPKYQQLKDDILALHDAEKELQDAVRAEDEEYEEKKRIAVQAKAALTETLVRYLAYNKRPWFKGAVRRNKTAMVLYGIITGRNDTAISLAVTKKIFRVNGYGKTTRANNQLGQKLYRMMEADKRHKGLTSAQTKVHSCLSKYLYNLATNRTQDECAKLSKELLAAIESCRNSNASKHGYQLNLDTYYQLLTEKRNGALNVLPQFETGAETERENWIAGTRIVYDDKVLKEDKYEIQRDESIKKTSTSIKHNIISRNLYGSAIGLLNKGVILTTWRNEKNTPLFAKKPSISDIRQGAMGDCYLLAALASMVSRDPNMITDMMKDNGDGTVTVRFFKMMHTKETEQVRKQRGDALKAEYDNDQSRENTLAYHLDRSDSRLMQAAEENYSDPGFSGFKRMKEIGCGNELFADVHKYIAKELISRNIFRAEDQFNDHTIATVFNEPSEDVWKDIISPISKKLKELHVEDEGSPTPVYVTVKKTVPTLLGLDTFSRGALWVKLIEKAYAVSGLHNNVREAFNYDGEFVSGDRDLYVLYLKQWPDVRKKYQAEIDAIRNDEELDEVERSQKLTVVEQKIAEDLKGIMSRTYNAIEGGSASEAEMAMTGVRHYETELNTFNPKYLGPEIREVDKKYVAMRDTLHSKLIKFEYTLSDPFAKAVFDDFANDFSKEFFENLKGKCREDSVIEEGLFIEDLLAIANTLAEKYKAQKWPEFYNKVKAFPLNLSEKEIKQKYELFIGQLQYNVEKLTKTKEGDKDDKLLGLDNLNYKPFATAKDAEGREVAKYTPFAEEKYAQIKQRLFEKRHVTCGTREYISGSSLNGESDNEGMVGTHAYNIIDTSEENGFHFVHLHNPHKMTTREYSIVTKADGSREYERREAQILSDFDKVFKSETSQDGLFKLELNDFLAQVSHIYY